MKERIAIVVFAVFLVLLFCGGITMMMKQNGDFQKMCDQKGGHVMQVGKNGRICVSDDGRLIAVR